ncbi:hypothetical protein IAU60_001760 [Kwoniella sp. DSM 27419]
MRFAMEDSSDDDDDVVSLDYSISSDEDLLSPSRNPRSQLARSISAAFDETDSEVDSEEEVLRGLGDEWNVIKKRAEDRPSWREHRSQALSTPAGKNSNVANAKKLSALPSWDSLSGRLSSSRSQTRTEEIARDTLRQSHRRGGAAGQEVWREGQRQAQERRGELRAIASNARARVRGQEEERLAREADDIRKLLEGMTIKHDHEEKEIARKFAEREKKLWADIDAAIKDVERREAELVAAARAAAQRRKEDEDARVAAEAKQASAIRAEAEKRAREEAEKVHQAQQARAEEEKRLTADREAAEAKEKGRAEKGMAGTEWKKWVDKQRWMKVEVIEPVKADKPTKTALRPGMRLMTRGLGQVVNTKESILRVTTDLHDILSQQLPAPPTASTPVVLDDSVPRPYAYLVSHLSKALIKQAESEVNAKPDAAFPLARIVLGLLLRGHAALGDALFARFIKKCPWVVPFYPTRQADQPREEYEKSTGRGSDESLAQYISRMAGICTLYFAILETPLSSLVPTLPGAPPKPSQLESLIQPALRFPTSWTWLSLALKEPMPGYPPIAHLLSVWIETLSHSATRTFGLGQMNKVWGAIEGEGVGQDKIKGDSEAARQRLKLLLDDIKRGQVGPPKGREWE